MKLLFLILLIVSTLSCQPNYWEVDPTFQVPVNDLQEVASKGVKLEDIEHSTGFPLKTHYQIKDVVTDVTYDDSQQVVNRTDTSVTVTGGILNFKISFKAEISATNKSKKYNGNGTAHLSSIKVTYTKSAVLKNGSATFAITASSISNTSTIVPDGYVPEHQDTSQLDAIIKGDLTKQLVSYYTSNIQNLLTKAIENMNIPYTFKTLPYIYSFGGKNVNIDTSATNLTIAQTGYVLGFSGIVNGNTSQCSEFVPQNNETASYINFQTAFDLFHVYYTNNSAWQNMRLDQANTKSSLFNFVMIDLEQILPSALQQFPNYFDKLYATCTINNTVDDYLGFQDLYSVFITNIIWNCRLFRQAQNNNLLNFELNIKYRVPITQIGAAIQTKVQVAQIQSINFTQVQQYPLANQQLAQLYLRTVVSDMKSYSTIGSGFLQPARTNPAFELLKTDKDVIIKISDKATEVTI